MSFVKKSLITIKVIVLDEIVVYDNKTIHGQGSIAQITESWIKSAPVFIRNFYFHFNFSRDRVDQITD